MSLRSCSCRTRSRPLAGTLGPTRSGTRLFAYLVESSMYNGRPRLGGARMFVLAIEESGMEQRGGQTSYLLLGKGASAPMISRSGGWNVDRTASNRFTRTQAPSRHT